MKVHGILYKSLCVVVTGLDDDEVDPQFGRIEDVIIVNSEVYFNVTLFETCNFSDHYQSYIVTLTSDYVTIHHSHLTTSFHFMQELSLDLLVHLRKL